MTEDEQRQRELVHDIWMEALPDEPEPEVPGEGCPGPIDGCSREIV